MKKFLLILASLSLCTAMAQTQPVATGTSAGKTDSWSGFWESLRMKIEQLTPQKKLGTTTAVGGVRGAAVEVSDVYWKGESKPQSIDAEELAAFQKAVALVDTDQKDKARAAFSDFNKAYPSSVLKPDADQALMRLAAAH
jgi:TolA-binding protein